MVRTNRTGAKRKEEKNINTGARFGEKCVQVSPEDSRELGSSKPRERSRERTVTQFSCRCNSHGNRARHVSKIESRRNGSSLVSRSANAVLPLTT